MPKMTALKTWRGKEGFVVPGATVTVDEHRANELFKSGRAEYVDATTASATKVVGPSKTKVVVPSAKKSTTPKVQKESTKKTVKTVTLTDEKKW